MDLENMTDEQFEEYMASGELDNDFPEESTESAIEEEVTEPVGEEATTTEEVVEQTMEQPEQDSVTTTTEDEVTTTETTEESTEEVTEGADPEVTTEDDKPEVEEVKETKSEDDVLNEYLSTVSKVKANKSEVEFTNKEKLDQFDAMYQKAANYTKKTQFISQHAKRISAMEEAGVTDTQFNTMLDVLKGDKDAITSVIKGAGIDALDIDTEKELNYTPGDHGKSNIQLEVEEAYQEMDADPEGQMTKHVIGSQWDEKSREQIVSGITLPNGQTWSAKQVMTGLHDDVKSGTYNKVSGIATKLKVADGGQKSDLDYYIQAGGQYAQQQTYAVQAEQKAKQEAETRAQIEAEAKAKVIAEAKLQQEANAKAKAEAEARQGAAVTQTNAGATNTMDYLAVDKMSDEDFMAFMEKQITG